MKSCKNSREKYIHMLEQHIIFIGYSKRDKRYEYSFSGYNVKNFITNKLEIMIE